jgi:ribonuclease HII
MDWLEYENEALAEGYSVICGVDEAGRGPLAGPVYAAAVILPKGHIIEGVNDSKKLSEKKRDLLFDRIIDECVCYSIGTASEKEIDEINILQATFLAMRRAVYGLDIKPDIALIDGNRKPGLDIAERDIIKGDSKSSSIAAASILAKVSRDRYMLEMAEKYPQYQFEKHKGYGTKLHYEMIDKYGVSDIHRKSFLKKYLNNE